MNILDKIIFDKRRNHSLKSIIPISQLKLFFFLKKETISLSTNLRNSSTGIIAEHKRRSPSKAEINYSFTVEEVVKGYENAGACGISL
jgi:indole-3-glycerol phosphate synthase